MCEFISWIEFEGKEYFLVNTDLDTKEGKKLLLPEVRADLCGHGAIRSYYPELKNKGKNKECSDFSSPKNFPSSIVKLLKKGKLCRIGNYEQILNADGKKRYHKITDPALAEYHKIIDPALAEYTKITDQALAEYSKIKDQAWAEYSKITDQAWAEYNKIKDQALAECRKITDPAFLMIVSQKKFRNKEWK